MKPIKSYNFIKFWSMIKKCIQKTILENVLLTFWKKKNVGKLLVTIFLILSFSILEKRIICNPQLLKLKSGDLNRKTQKSGWITVSFHQNCNNVFAGLFNINGLPPEEWTKKPFCALCLWTFAARFRGISVSTLFDE